MTTRRVPPAAACAGALLLSAWVAGAIELPLKVVESAQVARHAGPVTCGIPFARGSLKDVGSLALRAAGKPVPAQFAKTVAWDDGSVRWALLDCQADVPAGGSADLVLGDAGGNPAPAAAVRAQETADGVRVTTGPMEFLVPSKRPGLLASLKVDGKELVTGAGRGPVLTADAGTEVAGQPAEVTIEQAGPLRATVCVRGAFPGVHSGLLRYTARLTALAGQKSVKVHVWLENHGNHGYTTKTGDVVAPSKDEWALFDGLQIELGLGLGAGAAASCEGVTAPGRLKVLQLCRYTRTGEQYPRTPYSPADLDYLVTAGTNVLKRGDRTDGVVTVRGEAGACTAAVRDFWQNYEKAIETDGKTLRVWLWPTEGQWPRARVRLDDLYDNTLSQMRKDGFYRLPGGVHKGHELVLDFSGRDARETSAELDMPLFAFATPAHYAATEAAPGLFAPPDVRTGNKDCDFKLGGWLCMMRSACDPAGSNSLYRAAEMSSPRMYALGWMDYGDFAVPGHGPVSLHNDWPWIALASAMRTGDPNALRVATRMARHRIDVDQLWSPNEPLASCRGLQLGTCYGDFHSFRLYNPPGVDNNWLSGVALYYMLTGEPKALECARWNGESLPKAWKALEAAKIYGGPEFDVLANAWSIDSYGAMYALTADRRWLDEALSLFTLHIVPTWKRLGPYLHNPADQFRGQGYAKEDIKYCYSIAALCQLHHLTGDAAVLKLLTEGAEGEYSSESFFEAPIFLAGLHAYVGWKTGSREQLARGAERFAEGFAESKCPPCYIPNNSTWSWQSAMYLRSGNVLQAAFWKAAK